MKYPLHPVNALFPLNEDNEFRAFIEDVRNHGLLRPIVLYKGQIVDGKRRLTACELAGIKPRFVQWRGKGLVGDWIMSVNFHRRDLTSSQRAMIVTESLPLLEKEAKQRQRLGQGRGKKGRKRSPTPSKNGRAVDHAAKLARTNPKYVQQAQAIAKKAPDLIQRVKSGQLTIPIAKKLADEEEAVRKQVLARAQDRSQTGRAMKRLIREVKIATQQRKARKYLHCDADDILLGDMGELHERLPDKSVDMFFTDLPYDKPSIPLYGRLAELAAAKLKPGALCVTQVGHVFRDEVSDLMRRHLTRWWEIALIFSPDRRELIQHRNVQNGFRVVLVYCKPPARKAPVAIADVVYAAPHEKLLHKWEMSPTLVSYIIQHLTSPDDLIVDPFCGSGTVPAICKATGRRWLATDNDPDAVAVARKRLADTPYFTARVGLGSKRRQKSPQIGHMHRGFSELQDQGIALTT